MRQHKCRHYKQCPHNDKIPSQAKWTVNGLHTFAHLHNQDQQPQPASRVERVRKTGSTGDSPVPVGDPPTGRARQPLPRGASVLTPGAVPVPPGESPGGTGHWPTGIELGESTALFSLSSDEGGGEGRGEESRFYWISPLPNPLPARSSQGEGDRRPAFQGLIQWQWASGPCYPNTNFRTSA